jgi:hypothetical protein
MVRFSSRPKAATSVTSTSNPSGTGTVPNGGPLSISV